MFKLSLFTTVVVTLSVSNSALAETCLGEIYGINAGRGDVGILFNLNEATGSAQAHSLAEFSSAALAYDDTTQRMYYVAAPRPLDYEIDTSHLNLSTEQKQHLPISGSRFKYIRLAYYDFNSAQHVLVGRTKSLHSLVYDPNKDALLGADFDNLYQIDKHTGEATLLANLGNLTGHQRGDLVFKNGQLLLVTAKSIYTLDQASYAVSKNADHNLSTATGATLSQSGDLIVSQVINNDLGYVNKTRLFKVDATTGESCYISTVPARINDLATKTDQAVACYAAPLCSGTGVKEDPPSIHLEALADSVTEGGTLHYQVLLSKVSTQDVSVAIAISDITTTPANYQFSATTLTIAAGDLSADINIPTVDDNIYNPDRSFNLQANALTNAEGSASALGTIVNDDAECIPDNYTRINYQFISENSLFNNDWGIKVDGQYIKLLDEYGGSGSFDVLQGKTISYALAIDGSSSNFATKYQQNNNRQYWEDQADNDYNDFVVQVITQTVQKGCN